MKAKIHIAPKIGVLDPQGNAIAHALTGFGFKGIGEVRQGKVIEIDLEETDAHKAREAVEAMCTKLLVNAVIEDYEIAIEG